MWHPCKSSGNSPCTKKDGDWKSERDWRRWPAWRRPWNCNPSRTRRFVSAGWGRVGRRNGLIWVKRVNTANQSYPVLRRVYRAFNWVSLWSKSPEQSVNKAMRIVRLWYHSLLFHLLCRYQSLWRRVNARNISFKTLRWLSYVINSVDNTNLPCHYQGSEINRYLKASNESEQIFCRS